MMDGNKIPERMKSITQRWSSWSEHSIHLCGQSLLTRPLLLLWNAFGGTENSGFDKANNSVLDGIRDVGTLLALDRLHICARMQRHHPGIWAIPMGRKIQGTRSGHQRI